MSSSPFNPVSTSGIGFSLEHYIQASFLSSLLLETPIPFGDGLSVTELKFQAKHTAETDDLVVGLSGNNRNSTSYIQSKKGFEINANKVFFEVIEAMWKEARDEAARMWRRRRGPLG